MVGSVRRTFFLPGLCYESKFDSLYSWTGNLVNSHHSFNGFLDTLLRWDPETEIWRLELYSDPNVYAVTESQGGEYPLGTFDWIVYNDPCYETNETTVTLNFNACLRDEYNCKDGHCVDIIARYIRDQHHHHLRKKLRHLFYLQVRRPNRLWG